MPSVSDTLPAEFVDETPWWQTVAWPQVLTLAAFVLAVLVPVLVALIVAA